jgi:SAM-dependent methyltransferase
VKFPVNFIPLEKELAPVTPYLTGRVLNAGCGDRDISGWLKSCHASEVENCDIQTSIPGAMLCDLTQIPRPDQSYDSILCNAVLEHVPHPEEVMLELRRLLKSDGHIAISVPFLQPFHPTPFDFRRYTREGIEQLAARTGFRVIEMRAVHSLAQTLGWLVWAHLEEKRSRLGKVLCWLPIYLATRLIQTPWPGQTFSANGFQAVMVKT